MYYPCTVSGFNKSTNHWETFRVEKHTAYDLARKLASSGQYCNISVNGKFF